MAFSEKVCAATVNEKENNNSFATANAVSSGDTVYRSVEEEDDYAYFKITLPTACLPEKSEDDVTLYAKWEKVTIAIKSKGWALLPCFVV